MSEDQKQATKGSILVVDDEQIVLESMTAWFREDGYGVGAAGSSQEALRLVGLNDYDIAFIDIKMPGTDGLTLQSRLAAARPDLQVVIMTAHASVESAVKALKAGAYDYITKPFDPEDLSRLVRRAAEHRALTSENVRLKERLDAVFTSSAIVGDSPAILRILDQINSISEAESTVLIRGESGTGKELVARAIHAGSPRRYGPLVAVNCGALAEGVLESELFGHEKGSFTGAEERRSGKFELADGGTIFLDEISAVSQRVQVELLRVLEDKVVTRVGGQEPVAVDFRVVSATNQDLEEMVRRGSFRDDLYWRINVFTIDIPPLRQRPEDVLLLAEHFLVRFALDMNRRRLKLSPAALEALTAYSWPGNVRELQNAIERAVVVASPPSIEVGDLPVRVTTSTARGGSLSLSEVEKQHIRSVLESCEWNIARAARTLGVDRGTLYNKIHKYGFDRPANIRRR
ncbi:MAG: sigma-54 dependent transcriptional regulator [Acidobacteriota bacterium]|nr:sigma-54 dependent transcriptional regulator [Acidobacteriota bacterium]